MIKLMNIFLFNAFLVKSAEIRISQLDWRFKLSGRAHSVWTSPWIHNLSRSEFICQMDVGIPCPPGVDKDLWSRFEAFEKWNAAH